MRAPAMPPAAPMSVDIRTLESTEPAPHARVRSPAGMVWARFRENRAAMVALAFLVVLAALAIAAPVVADLVGHGPNDLYRTTMVDIYGLPKGPNSSFWFGADSAGRDLFVRVIYGARVSLMVGVVATAIAVVIGVVLGLIAGYRGGAIDTLFSRLSDVVLAMPLLLFAIGISSACATSPQGCVNGTLTPGVNLVIVIIAIFSWPAMFRIVRATTLSVRESTFIEASRAIGMRERNIMFREVLPNLLSPVVVYAALLIPQSILFEAYLSFLSLGVPDSTPSWGGMLDQASQLFTVAWWLMIFPGVFLLATILAFNVVADGLRDAFDPRASE
jgi:ABC-type dipeptide/oligopeptide/nickel transport system permease subunit